MYVNVALLQILLVECLILLGILASKNKISIRRDKPANPELESWAKVSKKGDVEERPKTKGIFNDDVPMSRIE